MKYLFSDCRQSPVADAAGFFLFDAIWGMEIGAKPVDFEKMLQGQKRAYAWNWSKAGGFGEVAQNWKSGHMFGVGAKPVDLEKMLQEEKRSYVWSWSKAGEFGEDAPNRKCYLELELEQSR